MSTLSKRGRKLVAFGRSGLLADEFLHRFFRGYMRSLAPNPNIAGETTSSRRINELVKCMESCERYLEIGVQHGVTLEGIEVNERWGVDPDPLFSLRKLPIGTHVQTMTSDDFFETIRNDTTQFDVIFIDGLHEWKQTYRDLYNAFDKLKPNGVVLLDDVVPTDEFSALPDFSESLAQRRAAGLSGEFWHGDVWKCITVINEHVPALQWRVIDPKFGNPQALLWRKNSNESVEFPTIEALGSEYENLDYKTAFRGGDTIPSYFNVVDEQTAIRDYCQSLQMRSWTEH